jgi:hypothetical protein
MRVLSLRDTIAEIVDVRRTAATANLLNPLLEKRKHHATNVVGGDHLNTVTVSLDCSSISACILIK